MLSKEEWRRIEESSAAAKRGERRERYHTFRRFYAVPTTIAVVLGAAGYAVYWTAHRVSDVVSAPRGHHLPGMFWLLLIGAILFTIAAVRPRLIPLMGGAKLAWAGAVILVWLSLGAFTVSSLS